MHDVNDFINVAPKVTTWDQKKITKSINRNKTKVVIKKPIEVIIKTKKSKKY